MSILNILSEMDSLNEELLTENRVVTFGNRSFPTEGWAVILSGGPASGKSSMAKSDLLIDAKKFDVDELKSQYARAVDKGIIDDRPYDLKKPEDTSALHYKIKDLGLDRKQKDYFYSANIGSNGVSRPNVIYDITGDSYGKTEEIVSTLSDFGYKISYVWVITSRIEALVRSLKRGKEDRLVDEKILHQKFNAIAKTVPDVLTGELAEDIDEAWIYFSIPNSSVAMTKEEEDEFKLTRAIKLQKEGGRFEIPDDLGERIYDTLGEPETNPENPEVYPTYAELTKQYDI